MFEICEKKDCTACFACVNACPQNCISMNEDGDFSIYPVIDSEKCISCDRCKKVCPSLNPPEFSLPQKVFAAYSKDEATHISSTSGGIASELARYAVENGGVVFASTMNNGLKTSFIRCSSTGDVNKLHGSKYVHSHVNLELKKIKEELENGNNVLFIGTACQVAGLKGFLNFKEYGNLLTVDIVCHGVPNEKTFLSYSESVLKNEFEKADYASFRKLNDYKLSFYSQGNCIYSRFWKADIYLTSFLEGNIFRENCYHCKYARPERVSDITLGDFWGLKDGAFDSDVIKQGVNLVMINTEKGEKRLSEIFNTAEFTERTLEEAQNGNERLRRPCNKTESAVKFQLLCKTTSPANALREYSKKRTLLCNVRNKVYSTPVLNSICRRIPIIKNKI